MSDDLLTGLNPDQKEAVTSDASRLLVTAGAGSGKTFVIIRRIFYLVKVRGVDPGQILAVTFTRNAAREMAGRLKAALSETDNGKQGETGAGKSPPFNVRTFHSLCYRLLSRHWRLILDKRFRLVTDRVPGEVKDSRLAHKTKSILLGDALRRCISEDSKFRVALKHHLWDYLVQTDEADTIAGLPDPRLARLPSLSGIKVRSYAERDIANWLHERGIPFRYSRKADWGRGRIQPDFYLPEQDVYIEVWDYSSRSRQGERRGKMRQYRIRGKRVIEIERNDLLDFQACEQRLAARLPEIFGEGAVNLGEKYEDLGRLDSVEAGYPEAVKSFLGLSEEVMDKLKNHSIDPDELGRRAEKDKDKRTRSFYRLFLQLFRSYQQLLHQEGALDFNDLVLQAALLLRRNPDLREHYRRQWRHVLVDEYQDVNTPQVLLLKELVGPENSLACVGDDWQSIYGFRGSNVGHIQNFAAEFPGTHTVNLRVNYRSGASIVDFAGYAISKCKTGTRKQLVALHRDVQPVVLHRVKRLNTDGIGYVCARVRELVEHRTCRAEDILILYRRASSYHLLGETLRHEGLEVRHQTIHAAKGLEAPCVFLWGLVGGRGGFPSIWNEGGVLRLILPQDLGRRMDEERRVFYVALTRARYRLFLITERNNLSDFLKQVPGHFFRTRPHEKDLYPPGQTVTRRTECSSCGEILHTGWRFCPFCYQGIDT
ncbi:MAG: UvrD-helicase domain-containing protein [Gemmatimonadota bacterium]|nr:UvrD-helicase domain-containing protein [Gemmatimonadota bacterium]